MMMVWWVYIHAYIENFIKVVVKLKIAGRNNARIIKKKSKNVSNAAAINFLFSCVGFCIAETSELQKKDLLGLLWNHLVIHVQLADFLLLLILIRGKMLRQLPYEYHCVNIIKISLENANSPTQTNEWIKREVVGPSHGKTREEWST